MKPEISVIIPALNEEKYIHYALDGLKSQTFRNFETIVVDGGSDDKTVSIARKHAIVLHCKKRGVSAARNRGAQAARGRILLFLDADTRPTKALLHEYHSVFADEKVVASTGPVYPLERTRTRIRAGYYLVSVALVRLSIFFGSPSIVGSNFAVRADKFRKAHGFDESLLTYEDWDLSGRIKRYGTVKYSRSAIVYTSARRIMAWGILGYFLFYLTDMIMYHALRKTRKNYGVIR